LVLPADEDDAVVLGAAGFVAAGVLVLALVVTAAGVARVAMPETAGVVACGSVVAIVGAAVALEAAGVVETWLAPGHTLCPALMARGVGIPDELVPEVELPASAVAAAEEERPELALEEAEFAQ
jgi:hypothetical protein